MDPEILAPLILTVVLTLTVGGVLLLRPIAKRLGDIVELMIRGKQGEAEGELRRIGDLLETVSGRMALLEEYRQAPQVTRERLYLETLEEVLATVDKTLIDSQVDILPLLDLAGLGLNEEP